MSRVVIDPVSRVGGHLRVEVEVPGPVASDAWVSGTSFRGIERILTGRDPRDAWLLAERICGRCSGIHGLASVRAVERAFGIAIPTNARLVRNLLAATQFVVDHVLHFYQLQLADWVDLGSALRADAAATVAFARAHDIAGQPDAAYFERARDRLAGLLSAGPAGSTGGRHPAYRVPPEAELIVLAHSLEALDWIRAVAHLQVLLGGKEPHPQTFLVGGMALAPAWGGPTRSAAEHPQVDHTTYPVLSARGLADVQQLIGQVQRFVREVYLPDVLLVAGYYEEWASIGRGTGNYLSFGEFPLGDTSEASLLFPAGSIVGGDLANPRAIDEGRIAETVAHAHYADADAAALRHPRVGTTEPRYQGPPLPFTSLAGADRYSWLKAPRLAGEPMEVGPLARLIVAAVQGSNEVAAAVNTAVTALGLGADGLFSTLGRTVARAVEAGVLATRLGTWRDELAARLASGDLAVADLTMWDPVTWPPEALGWSLGEGPQGAVGHWIAIGGQRVERYQVVDASTWNASPRDGADRRGPIEEALVGTPVADPSRPLEILRTLHSFDPCPTCAAHVFERVGTSGRAGGTP